MRLVMEGDALALLIIRVCGETGGAGMLAELCETAPRIGSKCCPEEAGLGVEGPLEART